jgi:hypothetical protein
MPINRRGTTDTCCKANRTQARIDTNRHYFISGCIPPRSSFSRVNNFPVQDSFYKYHDEEELELAHANLLDFDHPTAIDMPMFASVCPKVSVFILLTTKLIFFPVLSRPESMQTVKYPCVLFRKTSEVGRDKIFVWGDNYHQ